MGLFSKNKKRNKPRTVIVGLDGVPYSMLTDLRKNNRIPHMSALFERGHFDRMHVCIPEISSVSWTSFMTGTQSGKHGIFGFIDLEPSSYKMFFPNFSDIKCPTLWDEMAARQKKSVVINMPSTYPAKPIEGALISGFVAIDLNKAVFPQTLLPRLKAIDYRIDVDTTKGRSDFDHLFRDLTYTLEIRKKAVALLWDEIEWDILAVVITGTDRLLHFLYDAYADNQHPYHQSFLEYFSQVDAFVGEIFERFLSLNGSKAGQNDFMMLSDHGFTGIKSEFYLNRWLQENGFLKFKTSQPETIMDIDTGTTAFALDPSRIYIHLKDKYPMGTVTEVDYERVSAEIAAGLSEVMFEKQYKIIKNIYRKEELYQGPYEKWAPDLVLLSEHGFDIKGRVTASRVFDRTDMQGMHTQDDAFFFNLAGSGVDTIFELKDLILARH